MAQFLADKKMYLHASRLVLMVFLLALAGCQPPKSVQIRDFAEAMDRHIGNPFTPLNLQSLKKDFSVSSVKLNEKVTRYIIKMDNPHFIGGKGCIIYRDVDTTSQKIIGWGYVSSPDKCRSKIKWSGPW